MSNNDKSLERGAAFLDARAQAPSCPYAGGHFVVRDQGVYFETFGKDGELATSVWICSRLDVIADTSTHKGEGWGRLIEWRDDDGILHRWAMPMRLLVGGGLEVRRKLAYLGLNFDPSKKSRNLLLAYLQVWPASRMALCVDRVGWHDGVYVLPQNAIGQTDEIVVYQSEQAIDPGFAQCGSAEDWREHVGRLLSGNTRLVFAASAAFAGPLLDIVNSEGGGFRLYGALSTGKSTALHVAASVWGAPDFVYSGVATANWLEDVAVSRNDNILILDEFGKYDPRQLGQIAFMITNGQGKMRANSVGAARPIARWRLLFLSAGEVSLSALVKKSSYKFTAAQMVRLVDIGADAGRGMGLFEDIHDHATPAAFALALRDAAAKYYGAVGLAWLERIVAERAQLDGALRRDMEQFAALPGEAATGQVVRVARRFGLVAAAGELATRYGLTGWQEGEAIAAAKACFLSWLEGFGGAYVPYETQAILAQVKTFLEVHGKSRFQRLDIDDDRTIHNRVGFVRQREGVTEYLILSEAFRREVCKGYDTKTAIRALRDAGWLVPGGDGKSTQKPRIPGMGPTRCYVLRPDFADQYEKPVGQGGQVGQDYESMGYVSHPQFAQVGQGGHDADDVPPVPHPHRPGGTPETQYLRAVPPVPPVPPEKTSTCIEDARL